MKSNHNLDRLATVLTSLLFLAIALCLGAKWYLDTRTVTQPFNQVENLDNRVMALEAHISQLQERVNLLDSTKPKADTQTDSPSSKASASLPAK